MKNVLHLLRLVAIWVGVAIWIVYFAVLMGAVTPGGSEYWDPDPEDPYFARR